MELKCVQEFMKAEYYERDMKRGLYATFTWLVEEIGELAEAILNGDKDRIEEEIADVLAWTLSLANMLGIDTEKALERKYGISRMCK